MSLLDTALHPPPSARMPIRVATVGLVAVLVVLTLFSVTVSITNSNGTERAQRAAAESDLFERASEALLVQEELAEEVVAEYGDETLAEYAVGDRATHAALQDLRWLPTDSHGPEEIGQLQQTHARYGAAVKRMFAVAAEDPALAEPFEEQHVDPHFDPLADVLAEHVRTRYADATAALASISRTQRLLEVATPAVFGVSLVVLSAFMTVLARSRRMIADQASENRHQSLHDALTGLPNRALLHLRGSQCLLQAAESGRQTALLLLDLDRFREINDTLGHQSGDLVLQSVGRRLRRSVRSTDIVTRLGGDEFAILLPQVQDEQAALALAVKIQDELHTSIHVGGVLIDIGSSMGIALSGVHGNDIESLLQHADIAMYRAKEHALDVCVYDEGFNEHSREQLGLLGELRRALDGDELVLHFQPKITLPGGGFHGAEALLRWDHPSRGLISPGLFLPAAERTALIRPLTSWVVDAALAECRRWADDGRSLTVAVNVSARNLLDPDFGDEVLRALARWDLPSSCLVLEVTESAIMLDPVQASVILRRFARRGIQIAIDDFGAGYTSLAHLRTLPIQELKLDKSLVQQMVVSQADLLIVKAVIDMAHSLGLRTVAEGIEDADTLAAVNELGCDISQGYYLARPMSAEDMRTWSPSRGCHVAAR